MSFDQAVENLGVFDLISAASLDALKLQGSSASLSNRRSSNVSLKSIPVPQPTTPEPLLSTPRKSHADAPKLSIPSSLPATPVKTPLVHATHAIGSPPELTMPSPQPIAFRPLASAAKHLDDLLKATTSPKRVVSSPRFSYSAFSRLDAAPIPISLPQQPSTSPHPRGLPSPTHASSTPRRHAHTVARAGLPLSPRSTRAVEMRMVEQPTRDDKAGDVRGVDGANVVCLRTPRTPHKAYTPFSITNASPQHPGKTKSGFFNSPQSRSKNSGFFPNSPSFSTSQKDSVLSTRNSSTGYADDDGDLLCISIPLTEQTMTTENTVMNTEEFCLNNRPQSFSSTSLPLSSSSSMVCPPLPLPSTSTSLPPPLSGLPSPRIATHPLSPTRGTRTILSSDTRTGNYADTHIENNKDSHIRTSTGYMSPRNGNIMDRIAVPSSIPEEEFSEDDQHFDTHVSINNDALLRRNGSENAFCGEDVDRHSECRVVDTVSTPTIDIAPQVTRVSSQTADNGTEVMCVVAQVECAVASLSLQEKTRPSAAESETTSVSQVASNSPVFIKSDTISTNTTNPTAAAAALPAMPANTVTRASSSSHVTHNLLSPTQISREISQKSRDETISFVFPSEIGNSVPTSLFSFDLPPNPLIRPLLTGTPTKARTTHPHTHTHAATTRALLPSVSFQQAVAAAPSLILPESGNPDDTLLSLSNIPAEALASTSISSAVVEALFPTMAPTPLPEPVGYSVDDIDTLLDADIPYSATNSLSGNVSGNQVLPSNLSRGMVFPCASPRRRAVVTATTTVDEQEPLLAEAARALSGDIRPQDSVSHRTFGNILRPSASSSLSQSHSSRSANARPLRVMDAPNIVNDFYLSLVDWSSANILVAALNDRVYLWDAAMDTVTEFGPVSDDHGHVCAVKWSPDASCLAVSFLDGTVERYDTETQTLIGNHRHHTGRVGAAAWAWGCLTTGGRDGQVCLWDPRTNIVDTIGAAACGEVCGLAWSPDELCLAVGANDNVAEVYEKRYLRESTLSLRNHRAAVKALAWCPTQPRVLATGAGSGDRHIRVFDTVTGTLLRQVDTENQVSSLIWNGPRNELLSAHGFANHNLVVWDAEKLTSKMQYTSHLARVLCTAVSPDGQTVCSAGADETLRLWEVWPNNADKLTKSGKIGAAHNKNNAMMMIGSPTKGLSFR